MITSATNLVDTMRRLGDATSRNLEYSYNPRVPVSYGEATITESNLLELCLHHSDVIFLRQISSHEESKVGADWEWYLIGRKRTLAMRVQAKRVQRDNKLRIKHVAGKSGRMQYDLLVESAEENNMRPMYCIYCTESQRRLWKQVERLETGCLLADARNMSVHTFSLNSIEHMCWPWHLFFAFSRPEWEGYYHRQLKVVPKKIGFKLPSPILWDFPNISDLHEETKGHKNPPGVWDNKKLDLPVSFADGDSRWIGVHEHDRFRQPEFRARGQVVIDLRWLEPEHIPSLVC